MHTNNIELELTTICTLGCPACPRNYQKHLKKEWHTGNMPLEKVKWIADNTDFKEYLFVGCYGDPIYHPDIVEILDYYNSKGKTVFIETNASNTKPELWNKIADLDLSYTTWTFSVDGLRDTNSIYRIRSNWKHITYAMQTILAMPEERRPYTLWKWIEFPFNQHQTNKARELAKEWGFNSFEARKSTRWQPYPETTHNIEQYLFPEELDKWKEHRYGK